MPIQPVTVDGGLNNDNIEELQRAVNALIAGGGGPPAGESFVPAGGTTAEVLTKASNADGDTEWAAGGGSGGITSPADISDLAVWLDASDASTINAGTPADNDPVSAWADKSGNGFDAAQASAPARPVYKTAIQNGKAVVRTDGIAHVLNVGGLTSLFKGWTGATIAMALKPDSEVTGSGYFFVARSAAGNARFEITCGLGSSSSVDDFAIKVSGSDMVGANDGAALGGISWPNDDPPFLSGVMAWDGGGPSGFVEILAPVGYCTPTALTVTAMPGTDCADINIAQFGGGSGYGEFDIGEIAIYDRALNAAERRQLLEYLSAKWATL